MRLLKILYLLTVVTLFVGCVKEDMSDCPPSFNTELTFSYQGDDQNPVMFSQMIERVTLAVFDRTGAHILDKTVEKADLRTFQGVRIYLPEGDDYKIVCWGNAFEHTEILNNSYAAGRIYAPAFHTSPQGKITTNDHLYFGEYAITVPPAEQMGDKVTVGDIPFKGAHINLEVYIKGFGQSDNTATYPVVEAYNLMPEYDFQMNKTQPYSTTYYPTVVWDATKSVMAARFQVLHFANDNTVTIAIKEPGSLNEVKAEVNLKKYMAENNITVQDNAGNILNEATVRILFEFIGLDFTIKLPDWGGGDIAPEI